MNKRHILALLLAIAALLPSVAADSCDAPGTRQRESYRSQISGGSRTYSLYLPPCYRAGQARYPLLMLLHGSDADDSQWERLGFLDALDAAIQSNAAPAMIALMPFGDAIANDNSFDAVSYDRLLLELLEMATQRYRVGERVGIGGISRGGFWAYQLGLRFPDIFAAVGGHSPFFDPAHVAAQHNPLHLARQFDAGSGTRFWLDRGSRDYAADGVDRMHLALRQRDIEHTYRVFPAGEHDEGSWKRHIGDYLDFYAAALSQSNEAILRLPVTRSNARELWLPTVAFPALKTSISSDDLNAILSGAYDRRLIMSHASADRMTQLGIPLHSRTRLVAEDSLQTALWRDKSSFTLLPFHQLNPRLRPLWLDDKLIVDQLENYPLAFRSDVPNFASNRLTRITVSGTTAIARRTREAIDRLGVDYAVGGIGDYARASDFFHITSEAPIAPSCPMFTDSVLGGGNSLCMKPEHSVIFDMLDVDVVDLSGNHINDFGYAVLRDNLARFAARDMAVVGAGQDLESARQPLILNHNGNRIGWLACNAVGPYYALANDDESALGGVRPGAAFCDRNWLRDALPVLAAKVDLLLLSVHYREYEAYTPTARQAADYRQFAEWGADVVIGTAEHKPMTFEFYRTRRGETAFIHFGLGNLFFDQPFWGNRRFFMDTLYIYDGRLLTVEFFPGIIDDMARPRLLLGDDQFNFLHFMLIQQNGF